MIFRRRLFLEGLAVGLPGIFGRAKKLWAADTSKTTARTQSADNTVGAVTPQTGRDLLANVASCTWVSVKQFGAVGDGSTDDAAAIQNAINSLRSSTGNNFGGFGGTVFFPPGNYTIGAPLKVPSLVWLRGAGGAASEIKAKNTFNASSMITNRKVGQEYFCMSDLYIEGNKGGGAVMTYAVDLNSIFVNSVIRDCVIQGSPGVGLRIASSVGCGPVNLINNWIINSGHENFVVEELLGNNNAFNNINLFGNTFEHAAAGYANMRVTGLGKIAGVHIYGQHMENKNIGASTCAIYIDGASNVSIDGLQILAGGSGLTGIYISRSSHNRLINIKNVYNLNSIGTILNDARNRVTLGAVHLPVYSTPDFAYLTGELDPATDNACSLGHSGSRWSAVWTVNGAIQSSDIALKAEIQPIDCGLREVLALNPISFRWKEGDSKRQLGFIGQEVRPLIPEAIFDGRWLGMNYATLVPVLVKAIQELAAKLDKATTKGP